MLVFPVRLYEHPDNHSRVTISRKSRTGSSNMDIKQNSRPPILSKSSRRASVAQPREKSIINPLANAKSRTTSIALTRSKGKASSIKPTITSTRRKIRWITPSTYLESTLFALTAVTGTSTTHGCSARARAVEGGDRQPNVLSSH